MPKDIKTRSCLRVYLVLVYETHIVNNMLRDNVKWVPKVEDVIAQCMNTLALKCVNIPNMDMLDDTHVDVVPVIYGTHVALYMRVPVIFSMQQIVKIFIKSEYFKPHYLVSSTFSDPGPIPSIDDEKVRQCFEQFYKDNNLLDPKPYNFSVKEAVWRGLMPRMRNGLTIYDIYHGH